MVWLNLKDMILPVIEDSIEMDINKGYRAGAKVTLETNNINKYKKASSSSFDLEDGRFVMTGKIIINDSPIGKIIESLEYEDIID